MAPTLEDGAAPTTHPEQYYEQVGHRGYYRDGWSAVTCHQPRTSFRDEQWELYDLRIDPTETRDLAHHHPDKLRELQEAWEAAAWANQVFPLDEGNYVKMVSAPPWNAVLHEPVELRPGMPTIERWRALQLVGSRDFEVEIDVTIAAGDEGVLVAHGDQGGGYALVVEDGRLSYIHNGYGEMTRADAGPLAPGRRAVTLTVVNPGDVTWRPTVAVDGQPRVEVGDVAGLMAMAPFEGIDVGIDRRSPVDWALFERHGSFAFGGTIHRAVYRPGDPAPDAGAQYLELLKEAGTRYE